MGTRSLYPSQNLRTFDRLIPSNGIIISPDILYLDVNDVPTEERLKQRNILMSWEINKNLLERSKAIYKGSDINRQFCVYTYKSGKPMLHIHFTEILDNPHGYGKNDFLMHKIVFPDFMGSKYVRYAGGDMIHMMFVSNLANRLYVYTPAIKSNSKIFIERIQPNIPCVGVTFPSDKTAIIYASIKMEFDTEAGHYILVEFNGDIYRSMDIKSYLMAPPNRTEEKVNRWIEEMNRAASLLREFHYGNSTN